MNYRGMAFSPVLRGQWNNYNRLQEQGLTIQTRIPLADGEVTIHPNYGEKKKKPNLNRINGKMEANPQND